MTDPWTAVEENGGELVRIEDGKIQAKNHMEDGDTFAVDETVAGADQADFDGLVLPGGVSNPDFLRSDARAVAFVRAFNEAGKPIAVICHGPWTLIEAGAVAGRTMTSWPSVATDLRNVGAKWVDEEVVVDGNIISSRKPDDLPAFCRAIVEEFHLAG